MKHSPIYAEDIVLQNFPRSCQKVLDFGCGDGRFTRKLAKLAKSVYACDPDRSQISLAKAHSRGIHYKLIKSQGKIPYPDNYFDCITLMGVLEHVASESETLAEIHRILRPKGSLFIYGINKGLLSFLDAANLKFIFPSLHRSLYHLFYGPKAYAQQFVKKKGINMFGDFTLGKNRHTHYSFDDLALLMKEKFEIAETHYYSLFLPMLLILEFIYVSFFKQLNPLLSTLVKQDNRLNMGKLSYCIVVRSVKLI